MTDTEVNATIAALQQQRNAAQDQIVQLYVANGQLQEQLKAALAQIPVPTEA